MPKQARVTRLTQNLLQGTVRDLLSDAFEHWQAIVRKNKMRSKYGLEPALGVKEYASIGIITVGWSILGFILSICIIAGLVKIGSWLFASSPLPKPDIVAKSPRIEWWGMSIPDRRERNYSEWTWREEYSKWRIQQETKGLEP